MKGIKVWIVRTMLLACLLACAGCLQRNVSPQENPVEVEQVGSSGDQIRLAASLTAPEEVSPCDPIPLDFRVTNLGEKAVTLLTWYTPLEGVAGKIFQVTFQGQELDYLGILAMRGDPTADQYIILDPGGSAAAEVDIARYYDFSQPGSYQISYLSPFISYASTTPGELARGMDDLGPVEISSRPVTITVLPLGEGSTSCGASGNGQPQTTGDELVFQLSGVVLDASPSARIITLEEPVDGFSTIALLEDTELVDQNGEPLSLAQVLPGMGVEAAGRPGDGGSLIADQVIITR